MTEYPKPDPAPLIAIVDDDNSLRSSAQMLVNSFGFRTEAFASAREVLNWPLLGDAACLILDVFMPGMNGLELQRQLGQTHPHIPIIFITAHAKEEDERHALRAGAVAMLRKPVADDVLFEALRRALDPESFGQSGSPAKNS
ncbi:MAG: response regulator receiver protein [Verrucomicrobia bacterium]|nr:response regulator receiver protein [Verrucomicrobiota bacterium]